MSTNGWSEWQNHVLAELKRLNGCIDKLEQSNESAHDSIKGSIATLRTDVAMLKVKAGLWGALAGVLPGSVALIWFLINYLSGG